MFYDVFSKLCSEKGVSPSFVVQQVGLSKPNATYWKQGSIPKGKTLQKLADYFCVSVDYLLDLPPKDLEEIKYFEDCAVNSTGESREHAHKRLIEQKIDEIPFEQYIDAMDAADAAVVEMFRAISDSQLMEYLLDYYRHLNRRGQIEAVIRIEELADAGRFKNNPPEDIEDSSAAEQPEEALSEEE